MNATLTDFEQEARVSPRLQVTQHAFERERERFHWRPWTLLRMAVRALRAGFAPGDAAGSLRYFLESKASAQTTSCPFLYGENVYVFGRDGTGAGVTLLTVTARPMNCCAPSRPSHRAGEQTLGKDRTEFLRRLKFEPPEPAVGSKCTHRSHASL